MSDHLDDIITQILKAEGGSRYTNYKDDRGGPTKWGITLDAWKDVKPNATEEDIRAITEQDARAFYRSRYIIDPNFHKLPPLLMELVVDCGVNHGPSRAAKWLQKAVGATEDGIVGKRTIKAVQEANLTATYLRICAFRVRFYGAIVTRDHSQAKFASGWNNRAARYIVDLADLLEDL